MFGSIVSDLLGTQYTIGELMQIDVGRQQRAAGCKVSLIRTYRELKKESIMDRFKSFFMSKPIVTMYYLIFKLSVVSETGNRYVVYIRTSPDFSTVNWRNNKVRVYCECADFKFKSAYILHQRHSLFLTNNILVKLGAALKDPPKKVNPTLLCKHAFAAVNWLVKNYQSLMKTA